jgi:S-DNA-T family DNA segregation ATPase FtsK/SpoIIIE
MVDDYAGFLAAMERIDFGEHVESLTRLFADGPAVGVHFVATADRRAAVPTAISAIVATRLVLRMADEDEFRNAGIPPEAVVGARLPPGRGYVGNGTEVQCAVLGRSGSLDEQLAVLSDAARALETRYEPVEVPGIRLLPAHVERAQLPPASRPWTAVIGIEDAGLGAAQMAFQDSGYLVAGPPRSGRSTALAATVESLSGSTPTLRAILLAPRKSLLLDARAWDGVARGATQCEELARSLADEIRMSDMDIAEPSTLIVIDDGEELIDSGVGTALELLIRRGRDQGYRICGAVETRAAHRAYGGWIAELRKGRRGVLLQPDLDLDGDLFGVRLARSTNRVFPPGRGFLVQGGSAVLVQVALPAPV